MTEGRTEGTTSGMTSAAYACNAARLDLKCQGTPCQAVMLLTSWLYLGAHDPCTQQEGKQQLVLLKQAATDIAIEGVGEVLLDVGQAHCHAL